MIRSVARRVLLRSCLRKRTFHFASSEYNATFQGLPGVNTDVLRSQALAYLDSFDKQVWYDEPVREMDRLSREY